MFVKYFFLNITIKNGKVLKYVKKNIYIKNFNYKKLNIALYLNIVLYNVVIF